MAALINPNHGTVTARDPRENINRVIIINVWVLPSHVYIKPRSAWRGKSDTRSITDFSCLHFVLIQNMVFISANTTFNVCRPGISHPSRHLFASTNKRQTKNPLLFFTELSDQTDKRPPASSSHSWIRQCCLFVLVSYVLFHFSACMVKPDCVTSCIHVMGYSYGHEHFCSLFIMLSLSNLPVNEHGR